MIWNSDISGRLYIKAVFLNILKSFLMYNLWLQLKLSISLQKVKVKKLFLQFLLKLFIIVCLIVCTHHLWSRRSIAGVAITHCFHDVSTSQVHVLSILVQIRSVTSNSERTIDHFSATATNTYDFGNHCQRETLWQSNHINMDVISSNKLCFRTGTLTCL